MRVVVIDWLHLYCSMKTTEKRVRWRGNVFWRAFFVRMKSTSLKYDCLSGRISVA